MEKEEKKKTKKSQKIKKNNENLQKKSKKSEKFAKNELKSEKKGKNTNSKKTSKKGIYWFLGVSGLSVALLLSCQLFFENVLTGSEKFYDNTFINGLDVSGLSVAEAENVVLTDMLSSCKDIEITLESGENSWTLSGSDFEVTNKIQPIIKNLSKIGRDGNFFQNFFKEKEVEKNGQNFTISYTNILGNIDEKIDEIISQVEQEARPASLVFQPNSEELFVIDEGQSAILVNRDALYQEIDNALKNSKQVEIEIPIFEIENEFDAEELKDSVIMRSEFSTSYATSSSARKNNIKKALSSFDGMIVESGETISFNETTGPRTEEQGYQNAHIIVGGVYVDGIGGGVCQASTTLYNALLLADVEIVSVNHHSLPASYVPLSFDAMVSGNYSDLVFKNNLESPIYIKTYADDEKVSVQIFGERFDDDITIKERSELVKILPHNGDMVLADSKGEYQDKILYKGEYYRVKYPREGYESKGYLQYYKDGELVEEKEIRHDYYQSQDGIVMEGVEQPAECMTIPPSEVKIIKPQKVTKASEDAVRAKLEKTNPSEYNP